MAGRPVRGRELAGDRCDALVPPGPPPLTWKRPVPSSASTLASAQRSASVATPAGSRRPAGAVLNPSAPACIASRTSRLHGRELLRRGLGALRCGLAHHIAADAGMADQGPDVDAALLAERLQVLADRLPGDVDPLPASR